MNSHVREKWIRLPSAWISDKNRLNDLRYQDGLADNIMALMCLTVIAHQANQQTGYARVTYDQFEAALAKSRSLVSRGLQVLYGLNLISAGQKRSEFQLSNFDPVAAYEKPEYRWAKLPNKSLYRGSTLIFFSDLTLRGRTELDALKLMFLFAALRDSKLNIAKISYDKIPEKTGIPRERIKRALSLLSVNGIVFVESMPSTQSYYGIAHGYRLAGIESYFHAGTIGRGLMEETDFLQMGNAKIDF